MLYTIRVSLLLAVFPAFLAAQSTASIQGTVTDRTTNKPIASAYVTATRDGLPPASQTVTSAKDGTFEIQKLPAGTYLVCVQVPGGGYLNPCQWERTSPSVTLTNGQKVTGTALRIQSGSVLKVRLEDPGKLLDQKRADGHDPHLSIGVWAPGMFHPAVAASKDGKGAEFQITVPRDMRLTLAVQSKHLRITGATGAVLSAAGDRQDFQQDTGNANPKSFSYTITGLIP